MNIIVPMAGGGTITQRGQRKPRFLADVEGKPLFARALSGYKDSDRIYFIIRRTHYEKYGLNNMIADYVSSNAKVLLLDEQTAGQADTALAINRYVNNDDPLVIVSPDHIANCDLHNVRITAEQDKSLGVIVVANEIKAGDSKFYVSLRRTDPEDVDYEVNYITPDYGNECYAVAGIYYWHFGFQFIRYARQMVKKKHSYEGRYFIAPVFNEAVMDNQKLSVYTVQSSWFIQRADHIRTFIQDGK